MARASSCSHQRDSSHTNSAASSGINQFITPIITLIQQCPHHSSVPVHMKLPQPLAPPSHVAGRRKEKTQQQACTRNMTMRHGTRPEGPHSSLKIVCREKPPAINTVHQSHIPPQHQSSSTSLMLTPSYSFVAISAIPPSIATAFTRVQLFDHNQIQQMHPDL